MTLDETTRILLDQAKHNNLYINDPLKTEMGIPIVKTETDDAFKIAILVEGSGHVERTWGPAPRAETQVVWSGEEAIDLMQELAPKLWGWRRALSKAWLTRTKEAA